MRSILPLILVSSCATTPAPIAAQVAPESFIAGSFSDVAPQDAYWRTIVDDGVLRDLLEEAGETEDVVVAEARVLEAEALVRAARATLFPALSASGSIEARAQDNTLGVGVDTFGMRATVPLDVFGANRARIDSARAQAAAAQALLANARLNARRSAGQLYATLRTAQASRAAAERQTRDAEDSLALAKARASAGLETGLAVAQAQSAADSARARIPVFVQTEIQARLGLEALLGVRPGAFGDRLKPQPVVPVAAERLLDSPVAVLARRPDVRAAEARLAAAGLDAAAARADRWPTVTLSAALSQTNATRGVDGGAGVIGFSLAGILFDFGRLDALAAAAGARADAEAAIYRRTVTFAISAVENEANRVAQAKREVEVGRAAVASARDQVSLARARYTSGLSSFLDVLLAERSLADAEIALASAEGRNTDAALSLAAELGLGQEP